MRNLDNYRSVVTADDEKLAKRYAKGRIIIIDDSPELVDALSTLLSLHGFACETYLSANSFLESDAFSAPCFPGPCCILCDLNMPGIRGLELIKRLAPEAPPLIMISGSATPTEVAMSFDNGSTSFLLKPIEAEQLLTAVHKALTMDQRRQYESRQRRMLEQRFARLTQREMEVVRNVFNSLTNQEISEKLGIALRTTKLYRKNAMDKLGTDSTAELIRAMADWQKES